MALKIYVYGPESEVMVRKCLRILNKREDVEVIDDPAKADVAVAPLLRRFLTREQIDAPRYGTLIFHPSLLPLHRGNDAINWALHLGESYTGATWFWCDEGVDAGPICEQEVLAVEPGVGPAKFYQTKVVPSCVKMLGWIVDDLGRGYVHARPQDESNATLEKTLEVEEA
jgi:methionyl-tRNA formyltransferase